MSARTVIPLEESRLFQPDTENEGTQIQWHEHGPPSGTNVNIPHTWNVQNGLEEFGGTGWYSHVFFALPEWEKGIYLGCSSMRYIVMR